MPAVGGSSVLVPSEHLAGVNYLSTFQHTEFYAWDKRSIALRQVRQSKQRPRMRTLLELNVEVVSECQT